MPKIKIIDRATSKSLHVSLISELAHLILNFDFS